jgi:4'-phosphopantetheinyl transferase
MHKCGEIQNWESEICGFLFVNENYFTLLSAMLVIAFNDFCCSWSEAASEILSTDEAAYFSTLRFARRQESYLLGRYAAKVALSKVLAESDLKAIEIERGVFEQPILRCNGNGRWDITISHAGSLAVVLAYPTGHPMGIDIERIDPASHETILSQLSEQERKWLQVSVRRKLEIATALWAAKEALSKALRSGLMSPVEIYSLAEFRDVEPGVLEGYFENFAQYKAIIWIGSSHALSIVLPKRSVIGLDGNPFAAL